MFQISKSIQEMIDDDPDLTVSITIGKKGIQYGLICMSYGESVLYETEQHSVRKCLFQLGGQLRKTREQS